MPLLTETLPKAWRPKFGFPEQGSTILGARWLVGLSNSVNWRLSDISHCKNLWINTHTYRFIHSEKCMRICFSSARQILSGCMSHEKPMHSLGCYRQSLNYWDLCTVWVLTRSNEGMKKEQTHGHTHRKAGIWLGSATTIKLYRHRVVGIYIVSIGGLGRWEVTGCKHLGAESCTQWSLELPRRLHHPAEPPLDKALPLPWGWGTGVLSVVVPCQ